MMTHHDNPLGRLEKTAEEDRSIRRRGDGGEITANEITWRFLPGPLLEGMVPAEPALRVRVTEMAGQRRVGPPDGEGLGDLLAIGWCTGLAILINRHGLEEAEADRHTFAWFQFQKSFGLQPFLKKSLGFRDLRLTPGARQSLQEDHIVPIVIDGQQWTPQDVIDHGHREAEERGLSLSEIDAKALVRLGLFRGARQASEKIPQERVRVFVRSSLFDVDSAPRNTDEQLLEQVKSRFLLAFAKHGDDDTESFNRWFQGGKSGLINQLAKQRTADGGPLDRRDVTAAMVELGFRSFELVAECVEVAMREIVDLLPNPLTDEERGVFEATYCRQPVYGGLSLPVLWKRLEYFHEALTYLWEEPSNLDRAQAFYRMLSYYASMCNERRNADRRRKRPRESSLDFDPADKTSGADVG